jgi:hypothetical protein
MDKARASILKATNAAERELAAKGLRATSSAIEKLGAATVAIGGKVRGWASDFDAALAGGGAFKPAAPAKRKRKRKASTSSSSKPSKRKRKRKASTSSSSKRKPSKRKASKRKRKRKASKRKR